MAGLVGAVIGYTISFLLTPHYRAEVVLVPASPFGPSSNPFGSGVLGGLASLVVPDDEATRVAHSLEILNSREFALGFTADEGILHELFASRWSDETSAWKKRGRIDRVKLFLEGVDSDALLLAPDPWEVQERFGDLVFVKSDPATNVYVLTVTAEDPVRAADWANIIISQLNDHVRKLAVEEAEAMIRQLKEQLSNTLLAETHQALSRALQRQFERAALAESQQDYVFRVIDPAIVPYFPASPRRLVMAALTFLLGGVLMLIYLVSKDLYRRS